jgi:hypothetical protein
MSDPNQDQRLAIRTPAELAGAKAAEAQLEHDLAQARALGNPSNEFEMRLRSVRAAIAEHHETNAAANAGQLSVTGTDELRLQAHNVPSPNPSVTPASAANINAASFSDNSGNSGVPESETTPATNSTAASAGPKPTQTAGDDPAIFEPEAADEINAARDLTAQLPAPAGALNSTNAFIPPVNETAASSDLSADVIPAITAQNQSLQQSGQRIRAAIEQNSAISDSVFNSLFDALQTQNRRLAEQERKISEISGQIKSLKNP